MKKTVFDCDVCVNDIDIKEGEKNKNIGLRMQYNYINNVLSSDIKETIDLRHREFDLCESCFKKVLSGNMIFYNPNECRFEFKNGDLVDDDINYRIYGTYKIESFLLS